MRRTIFILCLSSLSCVLSTDLVAVYKHDILLLRDVDKTPADATPVGWESHVLAVPNPFSYPVGLTYDPEGHRIFVTEALHEESKIFSLDLDANYTVKHMQSVVKTTNTTVMEDLTYDPRTGHLYWTDSYNHGVYKSYVPLNKQKDDLTPQPEPAHMFENVIEPRGIAIDYCNELMYWSERDGSGSAPSSIEVCDLNGPSHTVIQQGEEGEVKIFYQGLTYDTLGGKLLWAETFGDDFEKSYCRIVSYEIGKSLPEREVLVSLENCFPFSLTTDENYIYWADWSQQGIMRASRSNPNDVVKLVHAPQIDTKYGKHHGVYGLAILDDLTDASIHEACKEKSYLQKKVVEEQNEAPGFTESPKPLSPVKIEPNPTEEESHTGKDESSASTKENETKISQYYSNNEEKNSHSSEELLHISSVPAERAQLCSEKQLIIVVIILAFFCIGFMLSTLVLVFRLWCHHRPRSCKGELPTTISDKAVEVQPRQRKRFGPKIKSSANVTSSCSKGPGSDGVSINIEDCCQMTLCDTPCYTTIKKEGRGYKSHLASSRAAKDDKRGLLDDMDDLSNF